MTEMEFNLFKSRLIQLENTGALDMQTDLNNNRESLGTYASYFTNNLTGGGDGGIGTSEFIEDMRELRTVFNEANTDLGQFVEMSAQVSEMIRRIDDLCGSLVDHGIEIPDGILKVREVLQNSLKFEFDGARVGPQSYTKNEYQQMHQDEMSRFNDIIGRIGTALGPTATTNQDVANRYAALQQAAVNFDQNTKDLDPNSKEDRIKLASETQTLTEAMKGLFGAASLAGKDLHDLAAEAENTKDKMGGVNPPDSGGQGSGRDRAFAALVGRYMGQWAQQMTSMVFEAQKSNLEDNFRINQTQQAAGTGLAAGIGAGMMVGGPAGAAVGAAVGGVSALLSLISSEIGRSRKLEQIDFNEENSIIKIRRSAEERQADWAFNQSLYGMGREERYEAQMNRVKMLEGTREQAIKNLGVSEEDAEKMRIAEELRVAKSKGLVEGGKNVSTVRGEMGFAELFTYFSGQDDQNYFYNTQTGKFRYAKKGEEAKEDEVKLKGADYTSFYGSGGKIVEMAQALYEKYKSEGVQQDDIATLQFAKSIFKQAGQVDQNAQYNEIISKINSRVEEVENLRNLAEQGRIMRPEEWQFAGTEMNDTMHQKGFMIGAQVDVQDVNLNILEELRMSRRILQAIEGKQKVETAQESTMATIRAR